jgi:outer membrane protein OmpA-like peptidoglycan-associated protein
MKRTLLIFFALLIINFAYTQETQDPKEIFLDAEYFMLYEEYIDALPGYLQLYEINPENANINYRIGVCYLNIPGQKVKSIVYLEFASKNTTPAYREGNYSEDRAPNDAYYFLGNAYLIQNEFTKAARTYTKYLEFLDPADTVNVNFVKQQIEACNTAEELMKEPVPHDKILLGENINDDNANFNPIISGDGNSLVYMSGLAFYDAIFYSSKDGENWGPPLNLTPQVQSDGDLYTTALSFQGDELLMAKDDQFNSDVYSSKLVDGMWTTAEKLNKNINTKYWESHAAISPDGKTLYFTSNRKGGYGGLDIYKAEWDETTADWGEAENLGPGVNTQFNEDTPFITEDGKTLYFSSQGHKNMGGFDIFYAKLDEEGNWSKPTNLGFPLNSTDDDLHFVPVNDGINGLYALYDPEMGAGDEDIYWVVIYSDRNPREVEVKGVVTLVNKPEDYDDDINISLIDKAGGETLTTFVANASDGIYSYKTTDPGNYQLKFEGEGYQSATSDLVIPRDYSKAEVVVNASLQPAKVELIILRAIFFDFDKYSIKPGERAKLDALAQVMTDNPDLKIEVVGHTDAKGSNSYNKRLSVNRANSTIKYLTGKGISKDRLTVKGAGEDIPIAINSKSDGSDAPQGRELNRRVEMHVIQTENKSIVTEEIVVPETLKVKKD